MSNQQTKTIWKYELGIADAISMSMPKGTRILTVQNQGGRITMWAEVFPSADTERRTFMVRGTGHLLQCNETIYIGTVQMDFGLVWHVYEYR